MCTRRAEAYQATGSITARTASKRFVSGSVAARTTVGDRAEAGEYRHPQPAFAHGSLQCAKAAVAFDRREHIPLPMQPGKDAPKEQETEHRAPYKPSRCNQPPVKEARSTLRERHAVLRLFGIDACKRHARHCDRRAESRNGRNCCDAHGYIEHQQADPGRAYPRRNASNAWMRVETYRGRWRRRQCTSRQRPQSHGQCQVRQSPPSVQETAV